MADCRLEIDSRGVGSLTLDRPQQHNAFDDDLIVDLIDKLDQLATDSAVRIVVLRASGKSFSAGADLNWMQRMADFDEAQNYADAMQLAELMRRLNHLPKPTIARVQGAAFGGGVGLIACCDVALAAASAVFSLSEVRLGLIPAVISPYVVRAIGERAARRYMLTAERFDAAQALRLGLLHEVVDQQDLDVRLDELIEILLEAGPSAQAAAKDLILTVAGKPVERDLIEETASRIASVRVSQEGREGIAAFLEKRKPGWVKPGDV
ncbi:MAG: enoyl-CoA hydratase/isomerase family protein [Gammaproteobacteria bacterium]|nr:MAG: enoyl-CoA hydratase/isomerase family protein [Gammaproteobacteria bacterium]